MPNVKPRTKIVLLVIVFSFLSLACFREFSDYIPLDITFPLSYLPNGNWSKIFYITEHFVDEYGKVFILRKEGYVHGVYSGYSFDTQEHIMKYFSDHLANNDWIAPNISDSYKCQYGLPEKEYVTNLYYEEYIKIGDDPENTTRKICVVIIGEQRYSWEKENTFKVILISSQYSPLTEFLEAFRRW